MKYENSYYELGPEFSQRTDPVSVDSPELILWNQQLADRLNLSESDRERAHLFLSGNQIDDSSVPIAQAYSGHQFGVFNPGLGDGRAHILGELTDTDGKIVDVQLKGSGQTRFSRRGDGRCPLKPAVREYIMSEAMHALGIPTTRTLAVVTTGEDLYRGLAEPGAVLTRVAASHIRVGTFQYFASRGETGPLTKLLDYAIARHYPEIDRNDERRALTFFNAVTEKQIETIVHWMRVGFIHGVMNTDNTTISGETIDYGPCAMMGVYHPNTVYSSIDTDGRYCFGNQPAIMQWNMARLAECLIPLVPGPKEEVIRTLEQAVLGITERYHDAFYTMMHAKLGLDGSEHRSLIDTLLNLLATHRMDYTCFFTDLANELKGNGSAGPFPEGEKECDEWIQQWRSLISLEGTDLEGTGLEGTDAASERMRRSNPVVIPRNHQVEKVLEQCEEQRDASAVLPFLKVLSTPYLETAASKPYQAPPADEDSGYQTFCGT